MSSREENWQAHWRVAGPAGEKTHGVRGMTWAARRTLLAEGVGSDMLMDYLKQEDCGWRK